MKHGKATLDRLLIYIQKEKWLMILLQKILFMRYLQRGHTIY